MIQQTVEGWVTVVGLLRWYWGAGLASLPISRDHVAVDGRLISSRAPHCLVAGFPPDLAVQSRRWPSLVELSLVVDPLVVVDHFAAHLRSRAPSTMSGPGLEGK